MGYLCPPTTKQNNYQFFTQSQINESNQLTHNAFHRPTIPLGGHESGCCKHPLFCFICAQRALRLDYWFLCVCAFSHKKAHYAHNYLPTIYRLTQKFFTHD